MNKHVYLAGPISGHTLDEANDWRIKAAEYLNSYDIGVLSPLRGKNCYLKDLVGNGTIADHYNNKLLSTQRGITVRDRNDVMTCDAILANLSDSKKVSIGTVMEIAWADMLRKPIVVVMDESNVHWHAMIR